LLLSSQAFYYYEYKEPKKSEKRLSAVYEFVELTAFALVSVLIMFSFVFGGTRIKGSSMYPTFSDQDRLFTVPIYTGIRRGDIVLFERHSNMISDATVSDDGYTLVKRVIAVGGDTVDIDFDSGIVYVNGIALTEPYTAEPTRYRGGVSPTQFPLVVEEGKIFVLGDNRNNSNDSRNSSIGQVDVRYITRKVFARFWPIDKIKIFYQF
jgi:signal peptidase I